MSSNFLDIETMKILGQRGEKGKLPIIWGMEEKNIEIKRDGINSGGVWVDLNWCCSALTCLLLIIYSYHGFTIMVISIKPKQ